MGLSKIVWSGAKQRKQLLRHYLALESNIDWFILGANRDCCDLHTGSPSQCRSVNHAPFNATTWPTPSSTSLVRYLTGTFYKLPINQSTMRLQLVYVGFWHFNQDLCTNRYSLDCYHVVFNDFMIALINASIAPP